MKQRISFKYGFNNFTNLNLDIPNSCLHCHKEVGLIVKSTTEYNDQTDTSVAVTFLCPSCEQYSVFEYTEINTYTEAAKLVDYSYTKNVSTNLPNNIEKVSPDFVKIYKQSQTAEAYNLIDICGVAYRKAAEFLIKDYVIRKFPNDEEAIKKGTLGNIISEKLGDFPKIQTLAKATAWLGNDETHYVRKHTDKDLADLKAFLLAAATFIAADYDADEALNFINK
ncbi:MAG: DUF4145 domain-containing protein [Lactococcus lactis]